MVKVSKSKVSSRFLLAIPKPIREALNLQVGDVLEWHVIDGKIVVRKRRKAKP